MFKGLFRDCLDKKFWTVKGLFGGSFLAGLRGRLASFMG